MSKRNAGIIAYGTPEDRLRLAAVSNAMAKSGSELIIEMIRARYVELFGDLEVPKDE